jgi:adenylate kinase family enzyme
VTGPRLARRHARIAVAGASGAGKTTLAKRLAAAHDLRRIELDALYYGPNWTPKPNIALSARAALSAPRWVTEWQYDEVIPILAERADLVIWLDYPVALTATSVVLRTVLRRLHHEVLWAGNREGSLLSALWNPHHILRYAWSGGGKRLRASLAPALTGRPEVWRFTRPADVSEWIHAEQQRAAADVRLAAVR